MAMHSQCNNDCKCLQPLTHCEDPFIRFVLQSQFKSALFISFFIVADEECAEENMEGQAVVHLDANILQRIKQEPVDCDEAPELTCVTFQQDFGDNSFKEILPKYASPDEGNFLARTANGNQGNESPSVPRENQELFGSGQSHVSEAAASHEAASSDTDSSGLRRSLRQRFLVQRLSTQRKEKASTNFQRQGPRAQSASNTKNLSSSVHGGDTSSTSQRVFPNRMFGEGRSGEMQTNDIVNDENDLFKRRFRKVRYQESSNKRTEIKCTNKPAISQYTIAETNGYKNLSGNLVNLPTKQKTLKAIPLSSIHGVNL